MSEQKPMSDERLAEIDTLPLYCPPSAVWRAVGELRSEIDRLRAALDEAERQRDGWAANMMQAASDAQALARVKALHTKYTYSFGLEICTTRGEEQRWPCATIRALEGATDE